MCWCWPGHELDLSGLGLAASCSIVKRHGGMIDVESGRGRGATFHLFLPAY
ncbi:MAG: hypothetical protein K9K21_02110 [Desulfotignum sp.]|nr:hypothetical protein [Desulfotignum sp.]